MSLLDHESENQETLGPWAQGFVGFFVGAMSAFAVIFPVFLLSIPEGGPPVALLALPYVVLGLVGISFYRSYRRRLKENKVFVRTTGITFLLYCSVAIVGALI